MITSCLNEYTRKRLLDKAKKETPEKFKRRTDSGDNWKLERVGLLELTVSDDLYLYFKVKDYRVSLRILNYKPVLQQYLNGRYKNDINKAIRKSLDAALRRNHLQVACSCSDFKYRYAYMATQKGYGFDTDENRPASITNPRNKGGLCKHQIKILNTPSLWLPKVVTSVKSYLKQVDREEG